MAWVIVALLVVIAYLVLEVGACVRQCWEVLRAINVSLGELLKETEHATSAIERVNSGVDMLWRSEKQDGAREPRAGYLAPAHHHAGGRGREKRTEVRRAEPSE